MIINITIITTPHYLMPFLCHLNLNVYFSFLTLQASHII